MEPLEILKRTGVDPSCGLVPPTSRVQLAQLERQQKMLARQQKQQEGKEQPREQLQQQQQQQQKTLLQGNVVNDVELPTLKEIQQMYGKRPKIIGLETCEEFRSSVPPERRLMGPAGLFNSVS